MGFISKIANAAKSVKDDLKNAATRANEESKKADEVSVFNLYSKQLDYDGVAGYNKFAHMKQFLDSYAKGVLEGDISSLEKYCDIAGSVYNRAINETSDDLEAVEKSINTPIQPEQIKLN